MARSLLYTRNHFDIMVQAPITCDIIQMNLHSRLFHQMPQKPASSSYSRQLLLHTSGQGSSVTYIVHSVRYFVPSVSQAAVIAIISAWAVGSFNCSTILCPLPTTRPLLTMTAPTGTSFRRTHALLPVGRVSSSVDQVPKERIDSYNTNYQLMGATKERQYTTYPTIYWYIMIRCTKKMLSPVFGCGYYPEDYSNDE